MTTFIRLYKTQILVSITLAVAIISLSVIRNYFTMSLVLIGALIGTFLLDLDYLIYTYFMEPHRNFSKNLSTFIKHKDFNNALKYIEFNKADVKDKTLNSALFQSILAVFSIFVISSEVTYLLKALVLSTLANSIYRLIEAYYTNQTHDWFWAFKTVPNKKGIILYSVALLLVLLYCLSII